MNAEVIRNSEYIVFIVNGGTGKNLNATAVVRNIKKAYPAQKIVVLCGNPELFLKNPNVYKSFNLANPLYFYDDYIDGKNTAVLSAEPYQHSLYIQKKKHIVECWCEMLGIECDSIKPEVFFTNAEHDAARIFLNGFDKPMVLCQFEGGKIPQDKSEKARHIAKGAMYRRSLPQKVQEKIVDDLVCRGYMVGMVAHENQYSPGCCERLFLPIRAILALIPQVAGVIAIDSFIQHGAAMFDRKAIICWAGTSPDVLGYPGHINLRKKSCATPECHRPNSFLFDMESNGFQWECPSNDVCCDYTPAEIIELFDKEFPKPEKKEQDPCHGTCKTPEAVAVK